MRREGGGAATHACTQLSRVIRGLEQVARTRRRLLADAGEEETVIFYDATEGKLKVDTRKSGPEDTPKTIEAGPFELKNGERLKLRIFVDKSVVEVFANSRQAVMRRIYPSRADSVGVRLFSTGGETKVHALEAYNITPSNPY